MIPWEFYGWYFYSLFNQPRCTEVVSLFLIFAPRLCCCFVRLCMCCQDRSWQSVHFRKAISINLYIRKCKTTLVTNLFIYPPLPILKTLAQPVYHLETPQHPCGANVWVGGWVGSCHINKNCNKSSTNQDNSILFENL